MRLIQWILSRALERTWRKLDLNLVELDAAKERLADVKEEREALIHMAMKLVEITEGKTRDVSPME
jgi:hypothetical protein